MREVRGKDLSLAPTFNRKRSLKTFSSSEVRRLPATIATPQLIQTTRNSHGGFLALWATKPTKELERISTKTLQREEKHGGVAFGLTGEGERKQG